MEKLTENTKFIIQRFDNYISAVNVKGNFLLAFNTFLTGAIISNYSKLNELITGTTGANILNILLCILLFTSLVTTVIVIRGVYPFLVSGNSSKDKYHSHIFFNSIAEFENDKAYCNSLSKLSDEEFNHDLAIQVYQLAIGLKIKYKSIEWAMRFIYFELLIIFITLIIVIYY